MDITALSILTEKLTWGWWVYDCDLAEGGTEREALLAAREDAP